MRLFFDTSALVKYYYLEQGSEYVTKLIQDEKNEIIISEIAIIEFVSSLFKKFRTKELSEKDLNIAIAEFRLSLTDFIIEPFTSIVRENAEKIISKYGKEVGIRTLDAMQLATYILIADNDSKFVCADNNLNKIAELTNSQSINLAEH